MSDAGHLELDPDTSIPLLVLAACPVDNRPEGSTRLWGKLIIRISPDTLASRIYGQSEIEEPFNCNYELNPLFRGNLESSGMKISGESKDGGARIIELPDHKFFLATGFVPQFNSSALHPHPLITAYLKEVASTLT